MEAHDLSEPSQTILRAFDAHGVVGGGVRTALQRGLLAGLVLREGRDAIHLQGDMGTGKSLVADVVHDLAAELLGRARSRADLDCSAVSAEAFPAALKGAVKAARGGSLVLDRTHTLTAQGLAAIERVNRAEADVLVVGMSEISTGATGARVRLKPLHEREDDIWALIDHYFHRVADELPAHACQGFSRQAKADIAARVQDTSVKGIHILRDAVSACLFDVAAQGPLPSKLTSALVRPVLALRFEMPTTSTEERDEALLESAFDAIDVRSSTMVSRLSKIHGIPEHILEKQAEVLRAAMDSMDGLPRSYRNIMDRGDDVLRASLWLISEAETQAEFRRFFGEERFMRPTKSVAWAFFNRVFKRDMG